MICISFDCPKYAECAKTLMRSSIEDCVSFAVCATCKVSDTENEVAWWCGPMGNYRLFAPKARIQMFHREEDE